MYPSCPPPARELRALWLPWQCNRAPPELQSSFFLSFLPSPGGAPAKGGWSTGTPPHTLHSRKRGTWEGGHKTSPATGPQRGLRGKKGQNERAAQVARYSCLQAMMVKPTARLAT